MKEKNRTGQVRQFQLKAGHNTKDRTRQDKTRQDKTRQYKHNK